MADSPGPQYPTDPPPLRQPWKIMADLAEAVDDLICSFDSLYADDAMDALAMLLFFWVVIALITVWLAKFLYKRYKSKDKVAADDAKVIPKTDADKAVKVVPGDDEKKVVGEVLAVNDGVKSLPAKRNPLVKQHSGGGNVPATPPTKRILSRMSPAPDPQRNRKLSGAQAAPTCAGPDRAASAWSTALFAWLYNDLVVVNDLLQLWILSMNEFSKKSVEEHGVGVELVRVLAESPAPKISSVFCECDSKDDVTITCDCEATPALQLKAFRQKGDKVEVAHYRVNVNRFRARLNILCVTEKLTGELRCDGWPDVKVALAPVGALRNNPDEQQLQQVISDVVVSALRNTMVQFSLQHYPTCPRMRRISETPSRMLPLHYDAMSGQNTFQEHMPNYTEQLLTGDKRLLVKVVSAQHLGQKVPGGCSSPYCVLEMDEPPQRNQTSVKQNTDAPYWDEHFLFELSPHTAELLFEVFDKGSSLQQQQQHQQQRPPTFLGLGIVGVEELLISPSQRQLISLQSRPLQDDPVSGMLTVEFLFIEGADIPLMEGRPFKLKESLKTSSPSSPHMTTTRTTYRQNDMGMNGTSHLAESAIRELERSPSGVNANKSTLIIHSVQRPGDVHALHAEETNGEPPERIPRQKKRRDFFGTIKRRLGRSRTRARSVDVQDSGSEDQMNGRSVSADRNTLSDTLTVPSPTRNFNTAGQPSSTSSPLQSGDESRTSRRSSISEMSAISGASTRTYLHEASTLVLETVDNGVKKHFLVPLSIAQRSRWRRKGTKLHIYNHHTFVAKHLSGGVVCQVCNKNIARRIGKQGYECRDCMMKCHKHCHVRVLDNCPSSTIHTIELQYITSPFTDKNIRML